MKKSIPFLIIFSVIMTSSCTRSKKSDIVSQQGISFLSSQGVVIDSARPYYSSISVIPNIFPAIWEMRDTFSDKSMNIKLSQYIGRQCNIYMYPVAKLPFNIKKDAAIETRAVVIQYMNEIICSYIEFISELRSLPPMTLGGVSLVDLSGTRWEQWKKKIDSDDNKRLVIWQYYDMLRSGNFEDAYLFIYDKQNIKKPDFVKAAKGSNLPLIDFSNIDQYKKPTDYDCYFIAKAVMDGSHKTYEITFDLKIDPREVSYGGWRIYKTTIK